ncbi:hypothetical protein DSO57_1010974 [Entomophthora muscae]|uniref:Uncharacterized protein n=2 Tax=Entomophthora muscae TaxID=34485 RepID=A0ACC2UFX3_9FUNG|nr:hypothetical protein DSO57_1007428 [Entomophthora muscae]KAJ9085745.1 hypothetical protein DSO57_1010974 [Entomophthora muscae]
MRASVLPILAFSSLVSSAAFPPQNDFNFVTDILDRFQITYTQRKKLAEFLKEEVIPFLPEDQEPTPSRIIRVTAGKPSRAAKK